MRNQHHCNSDCSYCPTACGVCCTETSLIPRLWGPEYNATQKQSAQTVQIEQSANVTAAVDGSLCKTLHKSCVWNSVDVLMTCLQRKYRHKTFTDKCQKLLPEWSASAHFWSTSKNSYTCTLQWSENQFYSQAWLYCLSEQTLYWINKLCLRLSACSWTKQVVTRLLHICDKVVSTLLQFQFHG